MNRFDAYLTNFKSFFKGRPLGLSKGVCALSINAEDIYITFAPSIKINPISIYRIPCGVHDDMVNCLGKFVEDHGLEGTPCTWILRPEYYQLLSMEDLPVKDEEFSEAIRWKIHELLNYPVEDALITRFKIPLHQVQNPTQMIMVVASRLDYLQSVSEKINKSGLKLTTIDIPELALRNVTSVFEADNRPTALIFMRSKNTEIIITCNRTLYFHRYVDVGLEFLSNWLKSGNSEEIPIATTGELDKLALELQRSVDFYQTQWRMPQPARYLLATTNFSSKPITNYLSQSLNLKIADIDLKTMFSIKEPIPDVIPGRLLPVIGGVLRVDDNATVY